MREETRFALARCKECTLVKSTKPTKRSGSIPRQPRAPWELIALDRMGLYPFSRNGKRYLLVVTDVFSLWVEAFPLPNSEAATIAPFMEREVFMRWGYRRALLADNASTFQSNFWRKKCQEWVCMVYETPVYHPQANPAERRNQEIKKGLRLGLLDSDHRCWDQYIPNIMFSLRRRRNRVTCGTHSEVLLS